jgi:hypothetical protein
MTLRRKSSAVIFVVLALAGLTAIVLTTLVPKSGAASNPKIAVRLQKETARGNATEAVIVLSEQADLKAAASLPTKEAKGLFVVNALRDVAARTQAPLIALLEKRGIPYQSFWVVNMIQITGGRALLNELAARSDVKQIDANPQVRTDIPTPGALDVPDQPNGIEWNVTKVKAPKVWALGFKGEGRVVAGADTGVQWDPDGRRRRSRQSDRCGPGGKMDCVPEYDRCWRGFSHDLLRVLPVSDGTVSGGGQFEPGRSHQGAGLDQQFLGMPAQRRLLGQYASGGCGQRTRGRNFSRRRCGEFRIVLFQHYRSPISL